MTRLQWWGSKLGLVLGVFALSSSSVTASPYYSVREVETGFTLPGFVVSPPTTVDESKLPTSNGFQGGLNIVPVTFHMQFVTGNSQGTIIGKLPSGQSMAMPYSAPTFSYGHLQPDGTLSDVHSFFSPGFSSYYLALNNLNQILYSGNQMGVATQGLIDLNKGVTYQLPDLLSPTDRSLYAPTDTNGYGLSATALGDDGSIVASFYGPDSQGQNWGYHTLLLTPPSNTDENPVPEPSSIAVFSIVCLAAVHIRRATLKRSAP